MQKLTSEEAAALQPLRRTRPSKNAHVYTQLFMLEIGEVLLVTNREWKIPTPPYWNVNRVALMRKSPARFSCRTLEDGSGWLITRIK